MRNIFCSTIRPWLLMSLLLIGSVALGQGTVRTGKVTGQADGTAIPGVNVSVKGTTRGVTTNATGDYSIQADNGAVLVYSFIGYKAREVTLGNQTAINITLSEDVSTLSEVVVTGYSAQSRRDITGAVATVAGPRSGGDGHQRRHAGRQRHGADSGFRHHWQQRSALHHRRRTDAEPRYH